MNFDMSWKTPTEQQIAALRYVCKAFNYTKEMIADTITFAAPATRMEAMGRAYAADAEVYKGDVYQFSVYDYAELILLAENSLWYTQACAWADGDTPTDKRIAHAAKIFEVAGVNVKKVVEWGYQDGEWWNLDKIFESPRYRAVGIVAIHEAMRLIKAANTPTSSLDLLFRALSDDTGTMLSSGWSRFVVILAPGVNASKLYKILESGTGAAMAAVAFVQATFDPEMKKTVAKVRRQVRKELHTTYKPKTCIKPGCENLVAPTGVKPREGHHKNYRGTGACQAGHNSYWCTKCESPHSHTSKIGKAHYEKYYDGDWTQAKKDEVDWE